MIFAPEIENKIGYWLKCICNLDVISFTNCIGCLSMATNVCHS